MQVLQWYCIQYSHMKNSTSSVKYLHFPLLGNTVDGPASEMKGGWKNMQDHLQHIHTQKKPTSVNWRWPRSLRLLKSFPLHRGPDSGTGSLLPYLLLSNLEEITQPTLQLVTSTIFSIILFIPADETSLHGFTAPSGVHTSPPVSPSCQQRLQVHLDPQPGCGRVCFLAPQSPSPQHRLRSEDNSSRGNAENLLSF